MEYMNASLEAFRKDSILLCLVTKFPFLLLMKKKVGCIDEILPEPELSRPSVANVNQIAIVFNKITFQILCWLIRFCYCQKGIDAVILINKIDLDETEE